MSRRLRIPAALAAVAITALLAACGSDDDASTASGATTATDETLVDVTLEPATPSASTPEVVVPAAAPTQLTVTTIEEGSGAPAKVGDILVLDYVGVRQPDGSHFDASYGGTPIALTLGMGQVIKGWDDGLVGATKGSRLQLDIPAALAYGDSPPAGSTIQAGDALTFVVDVRDVIPAPDATTQPVATDLPAEATAGNDAVVTADLVVGTGDELVAGDNGVFMLVYFDAASGEVLQTTWPDSVEVLPVEDGDPSQSPSAALAGMKVGGRRAVTVPKALAGTEADLVIVLDLQSIPPAS